ncbi:Nucleotide-diphospho-sugar transferase [Sesbania bispinosa]|nr:Nucleotide-diphospho-sugar transferase [Sesbania bispinosa]
MFRSSFDVLNPMTNPLLQDPDGVGVSGLTRGDKIVQKWWINEFKRVPFPGNKNGKLATVTKGGTERRTLTDNGNKDSSVRERSVKKDDMHELVNHHVYADGKSWGYFPGLPLRLSFKDFMDAFFRKGKCVMRVFMVWNSPPWMYTVRYQRGLESLLFHHPDACVVVFSETIELDFFKDSFVKDGYKVAVVMPNLDRLLKDTPAHIFSSVWFEWRKTKFYSTHYSELIRLAALYKYGGIYLDSDIIVLKPISFLNNSVGMEDHVAGSAFNGAVMAFGRHSLFIKECLEEFYMTYDDTSLRWNGADLLTRVARKFLGGENKSIKMLELKVEPSYIFFPISSLNITRYFIAPATKTEKAKQDALLEKILHESLTFHFWNSLTSALIPEPESLVTRLMNYACIRCLELL